MEYYHQLHKSPVALDEVDLTFCDGGVKGGGFSWGNKLEQKLQL